ncbi:hypothetical protein Mgra_00006862, partial [Meloidogyne graminicola]
MKGSINPFIFYIFHLIEVFIYILNLGGICIQFVYRYLILNRNKNISFCKYLYMFSIALIITLFYWLDNLYFIYPYLDDGSKQIIIGNFIKELAFTQFKNKEISFLAQMPLVILNIIQYFIIIVCAFKMIKYVHSNTELQFNSSWFCK